MVVALGPGRFYGSSLPRPRIYTDVKFSSERVDPPVPVTDPLISWAQEAHWSMGGLSFHRHRLQGRIEGNIKRLRSQKESASRNKAKAQIETNTKTKTKTKTKAKANTPSPSPSPPPAPVAVKRKRRIVDEEEEEEEEVEVTRRTVRKLKDEFDMVATVDAAQSNPEKEAHSHNNRGGLIGRRLIKGLKGIKRASPRLINNIFA